MTRCAGKAASLGCALVVASALAPLGVAAQPAQPAEAPSEAVDFYRTGREHFAAGRYREAIADLERALALDPSSATLVYNLARVYELLGELEPSINYYHRYLTLAPDADIDERARVQETIRRLEGARDQVEADLTTPARGNGQIEMNAPVLVEERGVADAAFWATAAGAVGLLAGGAVVGVLALGRQDEARSFVVGADGTLEDRDAIASSADTLALVSDVLFVSGAVAGVAAILLYALRTRTVETYPGYDEPTVAVGTDGHGAFVLVRGTL